VALWRRPRPRFLVRATREPEAASPPATPPPIPVEPNASAAKVAEPAPAPVPDQPPARRRVMRPPTRPAARRQVERTPVRWNVWSLERVAREHPESEELGFLVLSLREFADSAGQLPADFDPLVRESFGDLLVG